MRHAHRIAIWNKEVLCLEAYERLGAEIEGTLQSSPHLIRDPDPSIIMLSRSPLQPMKLLL